MDKLISIWVYLQDVILDSEKYVVQSECFYVGECGLGIVNVMNVYIKALILYLLSWSQ